MPFTATKVTTSGPVTSKVKDITDWNSAIVTGNYKDNGAASHAPLPDTYFTGKVEKIDAFTIVQTVKAVTGSLKTFVRNSYNLAGVLTWTSWIEVLTKEDSDLLYPTKTDLSNAVKNIYLSCLDISTGIIPKLVTALRLPAGNYSYMTPIIGTDSAGTTCYFEVSLDNSTVIASANVTGAASAVNTNAEFTLATERNINITIKGGTSQTNCFIYGLTITQLLTF